jgi:hypothetical protein
MEFSCKHQLWGGGHVVCLRTHAQVEVEEGCGEVAMCTAAVVHGVQGVQAMVTCIGVHFVGPVQNYVRICIIVPQAIVPAVN